ncbi:MAG: hypothetical protein KJO31_11445 [Gammaproteobacteria bacterium]|nr:hypothetical protein [Gammaproteobacteria bacterium]
MKDMLVSNAVIYTGIVIGGLTMLSAVWVWATKQQFGLGGSMLSFFGTVLIGLSVFSKAQITIGDTTIILESLEQKVASLEQDKAEIAAEVFKISRNVEIQRDQFVALGESLKVANPDLARPVEGVLKPLDRMNSVDYSTLENLADPTFIRRKQKAK